MWRISMRECSLREEGVRVRFPLAMSRITMLFLYSLWSRAILVWFLCCFTSDIFYSLLLAFTLLNSASAAGGAAAAGSTAAGGAAAARANITEMGKLSTGGEKMCQNLHHCFPRHHISLVEWYRCEMISLIRSWWLGKPSVRACEYCRYGLQ